MNRAPQYPPMKPDVIVLQPGIPSYRVDFFSRLADHYGARFTVHASPIDLDILTERSKPFIWENLLGPIRSLPGGLGWQAGAMSIPMRRGDILVLWGAPRSLSNILMMFRARFRKVRVIWWGHYLSPTTKPWRRAVRSFLMRGADALLFYTDKEVAAYRATPIGKRDTRLVRALNNGIDTRLVARFREPYQAQARDHAALFIGRLTKKANLDLALEALAHKCSGSFDLHLVGGGTERAILEARAQSLGISDRVHWHGGIIDESQIAEIANRCRVFLYPGDVGLSLVHALAYGLPAVVHDDVAEHMPEIAALKPGQNGTTFSKGSANDLAKVLSRLSKDVAMLEALSAGAVKTTNEDYNTQRMSQRFINCVNDLTAQP